MSYNEFFTIGIWGLPSAGKTTYISGLLLSTKLKRGNNLFTLEPGNQEAHLFLDQYSKDLIDDGKFPPATDPGIKAETTYDFRLSSNEDPRSIAIKILDIAGIHAQQKSNYHKTLSDCDSILFLIDPDECDRSKYDSLRYLSEKLSEKIPKNSSYPDISMAFYLTKIDKPEHWDLYHLGKRPQQQLEEKNLSPYTYASITQRCDPARLHYGAMSVVGCVEGTSEPNIVHLGTNAFALKDPSKWTPYHIWNPLVDLLGSSHPNGSNSWLTKLRTLLG